MAFISNIAANAMPGIRDTHFAPSHLSPFADDMARRLSRISRGPLLEISADTGTLTQAIASAMSADLTIIATDPDAGMVRHASMKPGMARVSWQTADPHALPFADATFGIVVCHFGVVALPDRVRAFQETRRVMKPNGRFVFGVPGPIRQNPVADCLHDTMQALFPADPPGFIGRVLHGYADNEAIDDDLTAAGFTDAIYTSVELPYLAASAQEVAVGYCLGTPLRAELELRAPGQSDRITAAAAAALEHHFGSGPVKATMRALIVSASG